MPKNVTISWEEIFDQYPEDQKRKIIERSKISIAKTKAMIKFRSIKEVVRNHLVSSENFCPSAVREFEKHTEFVLSVYRQVVESEGGKFKVEVDMPDHVSYNLFDLRDEYEEIEGTPLGPFYEEEDINEVNRLAEEKEIEKHELGFDESMKEAA